MSVRIPVGDHLALRNRFTVFDRNGCAVRYFVALTLATQLVHDGDLTGTRNRDQVALVMSDRLDVVELDDTVRLDFDVVDRGRP